MNELQYKQSQTMLGRAVSTPERKPKHPENTSIKTKVKGPIYVNNYWVTKNAANV